MIFSACDQPKRRHPARQSVQGNGTAHGSRAESLLAQEARGPPCLSTERPLAWKEEVQAVFHPVLPP